MNVGEERLAATGDPLDRPSQREGKGAGRHVVLVDVDLDPEAPPHVGGDDTDPVLGQAEEVGDDGLHHVRHLGGDPEGERARGGLELGHEAARLDRHSGVAPRRERASVDSRRGGEGGLDVA